MKFRRHQSLLSSVPLSLRTFLTLLIGLYVGMNVQSHREVFDNLGSTMNWSVGTAHLQDGYPLEATKVTTCPLEDEVHVLYTLSGNSSDFLNEFSGSLKSVLLNAPLDCGMTIHIVADTFAYETLQRRFRSIQLDQWTARNPISVKTYDIQTKKRQWQAFFEQATNYKLSKRHTIGAMFRLFAHEILSPSASYAIYMDTDTAVLSNLADLWQHRNESSILQWGDAKCSGFGLFNLEQMRRRDFWMLVKQAYAKDADDHEEIDDQYILRKLSAAYPALFPHLPQQWNLHRADNLWRYKREGGARLVRLFPKAAMVHMNGFTEGEGNEHNKFENEYPEYGNIFWAMKYYGGHPWEWTRYMLKSQLRKGSEGYQVIVEYKQIE